MRAQIELAQGTLAAAIHWVDTSGLSVKDELSYPREREYLALVRVRIAQGRAHPTGSFLSEALVLIERILEDAEAKMRRSSLLEILLLHALVLDAQGNRTESLAALSRALAELQGYVCLFIDEGAPVVALLR